MKEHAELVARLDRVESSLRRTQRVAICLGASLCVLVTVAAVQDRQAPIEDLTVRKLTAQQVDIRRTGDQLGILNVKGGIFVSGEIHGSTPIGGYYLSGGTLQVTSKSQAYGVNVGALDNEHASFVELMGPARSGQKFPSGTPKTMEPRVILRHQGDIGGTLVMFDAMDRVRAELGAQSRTDLITKAVTNFPESTLTLWDETGKCIHWAGTK